jgi:predicted nucleic-acid-binding Zn-ribbon protein
MSEPVPRDPRACPECGGHSIHQNKASSGGWYGPVLLPGLGQFLGYAEFNVRVCADCGLTRFYASPAARAKLRTLNYWEAL